MTREIKFRAWMKIWDEDEPVKGKMSYQILPTGDFKTWIIAFDNDDKYDGDFTVGEDIELMQYTGLKDKNGKEIYEGDVVGVKELRWIVNLGWSGDGEYGVCQKSNYGNHIFRDVDKVSERYKIIGNIYENPELLKD